MRVHSQYIANNSPRIIVSIKYNPADLLGSSFHDGNCTDIPSLSAATEKVWKMFSLLNHEL